MFSMSFLAVAIFVVLVAIIIVALIVTKSGGDAKSAERPSRASVVHNPPPAVAPAVVASAGQDSDAEVVAAIAAAIHAIGEAEGKQYKITRIQREQNPRRSNWGLAGIYEAMRKI